MFEGFERLEDRYRDLYDAVFVRRSCRGYRDEDLPQTDRGIIMESEKSLNALFTDTRIKTVFGKEESARAFSLIGGYGTIKNAPAFAAFIADKNNEWAHEKAGFLGEAFILDMTAKGFATCWVSGTYNKGQIERLIGLMPNEQLAAVTPIGCPADKKGPMERFTAAYSRGAHRKPIDKICLDFGHLPEWAQKCVLCAQKAPSAINSQPWFFEYLDDTLYLRKPPQNPAMPYATDLGISMLHVVLAAGVLGERRKWEKTALKYHAAFKRG